MCTFIDTVPGGGWVAPAHRSMSDMSSRKNKKEKKHEKVLTFNRVCAIMNLQIKEECKMNAKEIVSEIMKKRGFTNASLAKKLNYPTASGVSERLRGKQDMRADTLVKFLEAMDCEVVIRSKLSDKMEWTIDIKEAE